MGAPAALVLLALMLVVVPLGTAHGQGGGPVTESTGPPTADPADVPAEAVAAVARRLNCPLCQGYNLQDCPLEVCAQMRERIAVQLAAGDSAEVIIDGFLELYGPSVLNAPPRRGIDLAAWFAPVLVLMAAVGVSAWVVSRTTRSGEGPPASIAEPEIPDESYSKRLESLVDESEN